MYCNRKFNDYTSNAVTTTLPEAAPSKSPKGFAMMVSVVLMLLLGLLAFGLLSLSAVEVRSATAASDRQIARSNARLALNIAIGELQVFLGPDQRVSAPSSILEKTASVAQPHWVGVWSTRQKDGSSFWTRNDLNGGLRDLRIENNWQAEEEVLSYLVSGNEGGREASSFFAYPETLASEDGSWVTLVGTGSLGLGADLIRDRVSVPKVPVVSEEGYLGDYGFWVGDLGVRANVATPNAWASAELGDKNGSDLYPSMVSQEADVSAMTSSEGESLRSLDQSEQERLASDLSVNLLQEGNWGSGLWHEVTTWSQGVMCDVRDGGLRKDLTVFLNEDYVGGGALNETDNLVGPRNEAHANVLGQAWDDGRYQTSSPTFGILRDWVQNSAMLVADKEVQRNSATEVIDSRAAGARSAFANDVPVKLANRITSDLKPVVVEGSMYSSFSYHDNPAGFRKRYNIRTHQWPRVVLWNPYSVDLEIPESVMMMQLNSRNDFQTWISFGTFQFPSPVQWISWGGGTRTPPPQVGEDIINSANYNDPYAGMRYFSLPNQVIPAGECLVFSAESAREYNGRNILANRLSAEVAPDPARNFYVSSAEFDDDDSGSGFDFELLSYFYNPATWTGGRKLDNQADDARMIWKDATDRTSVNILEFDSLPQLQSVSCSLQYGAGREPAVPLASNPSQPITIEKTDLRTPITTLKPDVRSREGFRLRWFDEHDSNTGRGGAGYSNPVGPELFETAPIANWNLRSSYSLRSPWCNIAGDLGDGSASGPWFFGTYTRDLYHPLVGWDEQVPFFEGGYYRGNPFGLPQEGILKNVLFEVPRQETGVLSLAQFQHAKLSEFVWHPTYAVGNSLVDPRLSVEGMDGTAPKLNGVQHGGWDQGAAGWSDDTERSEDNDEWARFARFILRDLPDSENLVYDLSYEVNHSLWDEFFLSSGNSEQRQAFVNSGQPLPNGRMRLLPDGELSDLNDLERSASKLLLDGAFNVNSTNVEAWKALLSATRQSGLSPLENTPFPRTLQPTAGEYLAGESSPDGDDAWAGFRSLTEDEIVCWRPKLWSRSN